MCRVRPLGAVIALVLVALTPPALTAPAPATAAPAAPGAPTAAAPAATAGWTVERVRFEPLGEAPVVVHDTGTYRGSVEAVAAPAGVGVINTVGLEDYVRGISEVPPTWPAEAQRAQAIAARTYALWEWSRTANATYKNIGADICATQACQVYRGLDRERQDNAEGWLAAVDATAGRAIYWRNRPIKAMYSSSNGGFMVAGPEPYLRAAADPDDRFSPLHRWSAEYDLREVVAAAELPPTTVSIHRDGDTVWAVSPGDGGPDLAALTALDFRSRLNERLPKAEGLPLTLPTVRFGMHTLNPDGQGSGVVRVDGIGWGHAIGMSQWGAYGKARRGMKADDILAAYYAGLRSVQVPESRLPQTLKVAVELGSPAVTIAPETNTFRVVGHDGTVLAHAATGDWRITSAGAGGVRVLPPPEQAGPAPAGVVAVRPDTPSPGDPVVVRLSLPRPVNVTVLAVPPGAPAATPVELGVIGPGEVDHTLPPATTIGTYAATVHTDAGGGRVAETALTVDIAHEAAVGTEEVALAGAATAAGDDGRAHAAVVVLALALLVGVSVATVRLGRWALPRLH